MKQTTSNLTFSEISVEQIQSNIDTPMELPSVNVEAVKNETNTFRVNIFVDIPEGATPSADKQGQEICQADSFYVCYIETAITKLEEDNKTLSSRIFAIEFKDANNSQNYNRFNISFQYQIENSGANVETITVYSVKDGGLTYPDETKRGTVVGVGRPE